MKIATREVKSLVTKSELPEADYVINPYIGCQHACGYCYADFMKRFTGHAGEKWGEFVDVKVNGPDTIKGIKPNSVVVIGSVTDPYQPVESKYQITKKTLEKLIKFQPKLEILTKSPLILRDIDLLKQFNDLYVGVSIGILNDKYARQIEPHAPTPSARIQTLRKLNEEGISTYLFMSPIFPEISQIGPLLDQVEGSIDKAYFENLNIRGNNRTTVLDFVKRNRPELTSLYEGLQKNPQHWDNVKKDIEKECKTRGIKYRLFFHHGK